MSEGIVDREPGSKQLLMARQERFCILVARGETHVSAYEQAGYESKVKATINTTVYKLMQRPQVQERIAYLEKHPVATREEILETFTAVMRDKTVPMGQRLTAGKQVAAIRGWHTHDRSRAVIGKQGDELAEVQRRIAAAAAKSIEEGE